mmetsp:Transcript_39098/g.34778  ORF Transcript_39098/g.34778 Transcript_39098/m.34778 type:complete len:207 (+) Transcript_39098:462-1082(+)
MPSSTRNISSSSYWVSVVPLLSSALRSILTDFSSVLNPSRPKTTSSWAGARPTRPRRSIVSVDLELKTATLLNPLKHSSSPNQKMLTMDKPVNLLKLTLKSLFMPKSWTMSLSVKILQVPSRFKRFLLTMTFSLLLIAPTTPLKLLSPTTQAVNSIWLTRSSLLLEIPKAAPAIFWTLTKLPSLKLVAEIILPSTLLAWMEDPLFI